MSVSMWSYRPEVCDGGGCPGDCDLCDKPKNMEDKDDTADYIKRSDASRAMAKYMMDTALIDNPEASDCIEQWEGSIAAPVMSTVKAADVVEVVRCGECFMRDQCKAREWYGDNGFCSIGERAEA